MGYPGLTAILYLSIVFCFAGTCNMSSMPTTIRVRHTEPCTILHSLHWPVASCLQTDPRSPMPERCWTWICVFRTGASASTSAHSRRPLGLEALMILACLCNARTCWPAFQSDLAASSTACCSLCRQGHGVLSMQSRSFRCNPDLSASFNAGRNMYWQPSSV